MTFVKLLVMNCVFFNDTATTEIYTLSLHDALPIWGVVMLVTRHHDQSQFSRYFYPWGVVGWIRLAEEDERTQPRSEEHTSELQSRQYLVCRLLLEKKKIKVIMTLLGRHSPTYIQIS